MASKPPPKLEEVPKQETTKLKRKPSFRKSQAPPQIPVRQTSTSCRRMLKASNPLLEYDVKSNLGVSALSCSKSKLPSAIPGTALTRTQSLKERVRPKYLNQPQFNTNFKRPQQQQDNSTTVFERKSTAAPKPGIESGRQQWKRPLPLISKPKPDLKNKQDVKPQILKRPPMIFNRKKSLSSDDIHTKNNKPKLNESQSIENLHVPAPELNGLSPIMSKDGRSENTPIFKTPSAYKRRSFYPFTPSSAKKFSSLPIASTPAPAEMLRLQDRLNRWLKSRGKPPAMFHNLNKIIESEINVVPNIVINEIREQPEDENKENVEVINDKSESYEDLKIKSMPEEDIASIAKEATVDLIRLVEEGYPTNHCLELLDLIKEKYGKIQDEPEYWELRASVDEADGNFANAVQHFKTAIVQGAKIESVDKSLDLLLKKFSLLNISPSKFDKKTNNEDQKRDKVVLEARNIFKSSIIQIAIRERNTKKNQDTEPPEKRFIATPVRRSTRLSCSAFKNSPSVVLCRSLKQAENSAEISFKSNKALI